MTTDSLPPAPEGFAWMPCSDFPSRTEVAPGDAVALRMSALEPWECCVGPIETTAPDVCRLMRRLGSSERPWGGCRGFRAETGMWFIRNPLSESWPQLTWYAPVRFAGPVPDFGETGLRYLDVGEKAPLVVQFRDGPDWDSWCPPEDWAPKKPEDSAVPITLPPLSAPTILEQMCDETPGLREGIDEEMQRLIDDEANRYISKLEVVPMTGCSDETEAGREAFADDVERPEGYAPRQLSWCGGVGTLHRFKAGVCIGCGAKEAHHRNGTPDEVRSELALQRAEESERAAWAEADKLRAQLGEVTAERDEAVNWMEGVLGKSLQRMTDMEDWYHSQNREIETLKAEVISATQQRDALNDAAISALAGEVCTPAEGYVKAGANWLKHDVEGLVKQRDGLTDAIKRITRRANRLESLGLLSRSQMISLVSPDPDVDV